MAFVLDPNPSFEAPVRFALPGQVGAPRVCEFIGRFRLLDEAQAKALVAQAEAEKWPDSQLAGHVLLGWVDGITDPQGQAMPDTAENIAAVLRTPHCAAGVLRAYQQALQDAALGN